MHVKVFKIKKHLPRVTAVLLFLDRPILGFVEFMHILINFLKNLHTFFGEIIIGGIIIGEITIGGIIIGEITIGESSSHHIGFMTATTCYPPP